ncbi:hypothetical protein IFM89_005800 [Coptis chinensis]|uniref:C2HC zinc finger plants domain-containing protein n=1 Tax=Coptis chinensis TaxID=261450 RepID=A0A835IJV2_9MAGN|nr:hypothetical protein IFM89_005800 [Coptis chinensis]
MNTNASSSNMDMEMETDNRGEETRRRQNEEGKARGLLTLARQLINQGNASLALQAVVMAVKSDGGDEAVFQTLHRARESYRNRLQANAAAEELASLFAECAIAEVQPLVSESLPFDTGGSSMAMTPDTHGSSILAKSGRQQIMLDAFSDGSSFICLQCGGLVSNHRKDEHLTYWCCPL